MATAPRPVPLTQAAPLPADAAPAPASDSPLAAAAVDAAGAAPRVLVEREGEQLAGDLKAYTEDDAGRF